MRESHGACNRRRCDRAQTTAMLSPRTQCLRLCASELRPKLRTPQTKAAASKFWMRSRRRSALAAATRHSLKSTRMGSTSRNCGNGLELPSSDSCASSSARLRGAAEVASCSGKRAVSAKPPV